MDKLLKILLELKPDVDFETESALIDDGIFDSFDIIQIIIAINNAFNIEIQISDLEPQNFNSIHEIMKLIEGLRD